MKKSKIIVILIVVIILILALYFFVIPLLGPKNSFRCDTYGVEWTKIKAKKSDLNEATDIKAGKWYCCPNKTDGTKATSVSEDCIIIK